MLVQKKWLFRFFGKSVIIIFGNIKSLFLAVVHEYLDFEITMHSCVLE